MEQTHRWIPHFHHPVLSFTHHRLTPAGLSRIPVGGNRCLSARPLAHFRLAPLYRCLLCSRCSDLDLFRQFQDRSHRRLYRLGLRRPDPTRVGFLAAQVVAPVPTAESIYNEKAAQRAESRAYLDAERSKIMSKTIQDMKIMSGVSMVGLGPDFMEKMNEKMAPFDEAARLKYRDLAAQLDGRYQQKRKRQDQIGINLSRITPTASFISLATDATQTGQVKRDTYFQTGNRYYEMLDTEMFSKMLEGGTIEKEGISSPMSAPPLVKLTLEETLQHAAIDLLLLCFFAGALMTVAFLKFFRSDI